jgi:hypothetical protein
MTDFRSSRHAERREASPEVQEMINLNINRTAGDSSCLGMTQKPMSFPFLKMPIFSTRDDVEPIVIPLSVNAKFSLLPLTEFQSVTLNVVKSLLRFRVRMILTKKIKYLFCNSTVLLHLRRSLVATSNLPSIEFKKIVENEKTASPNQNMPCL